MPELALDHVHRYSLSSHLDRVSVAQLVWREPAPDAGGDREVAKLLSRGRARPRSPAGRTDDDAEERTNGHSGPMVKPRSQMHPHSSMPTSRRLPPFRGERQARHAPDRDRPPRGSGPR